VVNGAVDLSEVSGVGGGSDAGVLGGVGGVGGVGVVGAVDPVCGMTVTAGSGSRPLERDGVTYYFCCAGCRDAFEKDESRC
jgi:YHS domain-containing protein